MAGARIVAVGLLTQHDLDVLGRDFDRLWPVDDAPCFGGLLRAIDEADRQLWLERDAQERAQAVTSTEKRWPETARRLTGELS